MSDANDDLCFAGAAEQARTIRDGEVTARQLVEATLERIATVNPTINAYRVVCTDRALAEADRADIEAQAGDPGTKPLLGVPVAVKDSVDVEGEVTTLGSSANSTRAMADAPVVAALRVAGAVIVGKTTCSEMVAWPFTETEAWGQTRNPWNTDFSPGGSSGGSGAALAAGLCGVALGSDGLGSIRIPASFNGLFGLKPQRGRVWHSRDGWHGLSVNGPIARTVADAALFLDATAANPPDEPFISAVEADPKPLRIAVAWKPLAKYPMAAPLGDDQRDAVEQTVELLKQLGHTVIEKELKFSRHAPTSLIMRYVAGISQSMETLERPDEISKRTRRLAAYGRRVSARSLARARKNEAMIAAAMNQVFDDADVVLTPGATRAPSRIGQFDRMGALRALAIAGRVIPHYGPWNVIGQPAASVPAGFDTDGLPVSVQLAGRRNDEATLLSLAAQVETARPWAHHRPRLP